MIRQYKENHQIHILENIKNPIFNKHPKNKENNTLTKGNTDFDSTCHLLCSFFFYLGKF
jgi:hypothetical protein